MGAEQSALLVCTQTGNPEPYLALPNSELFFRLYFERMPNPVTGPVTEALLHLVQHMPSSLQQADAPQVAVYENADPDSGYENDMEMDSEDETHQIVVVPLVQNHDAMLYESDTENGSDSDISLGSDYTTVTYMDNEIDDMELEPLQLAEFEPVFEFEFELVEDFYLPVIILDDEENGDNDEDEPIN